MLSLKIKKKLFKKDATTEKLLDIAREERKTFKKEKEKRKIRKSQTTINKFLFLLFYIEKILFCRKTYSGKLIYIVTFVLQFLRMAGYWKCSNKHQHPYRYASVS